MSDKIDMIYDLLKADREEATDFRKEVRKSHKETGEKLTKLEKETSTRLTGVEATNTMQNKQLADHMRRTDILEELHKDNGKRIEILEEPRVIFTKLKKWLIGCAAMAGALLTIAKFLNLF